MSKLKSVFPFVVPIVVGLSVALLTTNYFKNRTTKGNVYPDPSKQTQAATKELLKFPKRVVNENKDGKTNTYEVASSGNIKAGDCLVQYSKCAIHPERIEPWEQGKPCSKYQNSYKIEEMGNDKLKFIYWAGDSDPRAYGASGTLSYAEIDLTRMMEDTNPTDPNNLFIIRDCNSLVSEYEEAKVKSNKALAEYKPEFKEGQCIVTQAPCSKTNEEWDKNKKCHPYDDVFKVKKVGHSHYLLTWWYGYSSDFFDLLNEEETRSFTAVDSRYELEDCTKLKNRYPAGNYSPAIKRLKRKSK